MTYNYGKASDLVKWCKVQLKNPSRYVMGGIGRYDGKTRLFDCIGLIKCFVWHDYSSSNAGYYGKTCPDWNCEMFFNNAKEKGKIDTIPEIAGLIVYQRGHVGVYLGNGVVIEATAGFQSKVVKSYFKGEHKGNKRTTWTHWFKFPYLDYDTKKSSDTLKVKDKVKIIASGNGRANGTGKVSYGIGWERSIKKIHKGKKFPYEVGVYGGATTGFYTKSALKKIK